jgi:hypothetical protein
MKYKIAGASYRLVKHAGTLVLRKSDFGQFNLFGGVDEIKPKVKRRKKTESPGQMSLFDAPAENLVAIDSFTPTVEPTAGSKRRRAPKGGGYYKNSTTGNVQWFKGGAFIPKEFEAEAPVEPTPVPESSPVKTAPPAVNAAPSREVEAVNAARALRRRNDNADDWLRNSEEAAETENRLSETSDRFRKLFEWAAESEMDNPPEWHQMDLMTVRDRLQRGQNVPVDVLEYLPELAEKYGLKNVRNGDVRTVEKRRYVLEEGSWRELSDAEPEVATNAVQEETPEIPANVKRTLTGAINRIKSVNESLERGRGLDERVQGDGRYEADTWKKVGADIPSAIAQIEKYRPYAVKHGIDFDAALQELGYEQPASPSAASRPWLSEDELAWIYGGEAAQNGGEAAQGDQRAIAPPPVAEDFQNLEFTPAESSADYQAVKGRKRRQKVNADVKAILESKQDGFTEDELQTLGGYSGRGGIGTDDVSLNEYYTRQDVAKFTVDLLYRHGFAGGVIEEPSCGAGVFLGQCDRPGVKAVGIEFDPTSSAVARAMNPDAEVVPERFERYCLDNADSSADAIVGNVPFGVRLTTKDFKANKFKAQWGKNEDLFVDASMDRLAPEGLMAIIVPHGVVSGSDHMTLRQELVKKGRVLGAYRLPESAFKHSDTSVVTDILVVQKHPTAVLNAIATGNASAIEATADHNFVGGGYFAENPEHILGTVGAKKRGDRETLSVKGDLNAEIMESAPEFAPVVDYAGIEAGDRKQLLQVGDIRFVNGKRYRLNENHRWELVDETEAEAGATADAEIDPSVYGVDSIAEAEARLEDVGKRVLIGPDELMAYRTLAKDVLNNAEIDGFNQAILALNHAGGSADRDKIAHAMMLAHHIKLQQQGNDDPVELERSLALLQQYRELYGNPADDKSLSAIALAHPTLLSLQGAFTEDGTISDYFADPDAVKALGDRVYSDHMSAMAEAYRESGGEGVTVSSIAAFAEGMTEAELKEALLGDPAVGYADGLFQPMERLLRGNGYELIGQFEAEMAQLAEDSPERRKLAERLQVPAGTIFLPGEDSPERRKLAEQVGQVVARLEPRSIDDMTIPLWAVGEWVPVEAFNAFMRDRGYHEILEHDGGWKFDARSGARTYQTQLEQDTLITLNRGRISHGSKTKEAKAEVAALEGEFRDWLAASDYRLEVEQNYNVAFNGEISQEYSGEPLEIAGIDQRDGKRLHHYQNSTIRQMAEIGRGIVALNVGLGKTASAIALSQHLKQLGRTKKPCMVVPKSVLANWVKEVNFWGKDLKVMVLGQTQQFWADGSPAWEVPGHSFKMKGGNPVLDADGNYILFANEDKKKASPVAMSPEQVQKLGSFSFREDDAATKERKMQQLAQNSYDLVLMSEPVFQSIGLDPEREYAEMSDIMGRHINDASAANKKKQYELQKRKEAKLAQLADRRSEKTENITWEDLGIDCLFHDEAHHLKNLFATGSRTGDVAFLSNAESQRSLDFYYKSKYIREQNNNQNVFLLTATPTSNNPLEAYNMLMHVCPEEFDKRGIRNIDDFLQIFGDIQEVMVPGVNLEMTTKNGLIGFKNLKDLRKLFNKFTRMQDAQDVGLPIPKENGQDVGVEMTPAQQSVYEGLRERANELLQGKVEDGTDHIFSVISDMDKAALDLEYYADTTGSGDVPDLDSPEARRSPKIESAVARAMASRTANGGKQIVFCDAVQLHDKIKQQYIDAGYPADEIQIVNAGTVPKSSDRQKVSQAYNDGRVTLVIGNTATMGEGMNFQVGTTDIHHLTTPWTPAAIDQRNGRGVRQGNTLDGVNIHYYGAEGSFDGYRKGTLERKRGWLNDLWKGDADTAQNQNTGGMSMDEMTIALSANPEATRKALESNRELQIAKLTKQKQLQANKQFSQLQTMKMALSKMSPERKLSGPGQQLQDRHDRLKRSLLNNEHFNHRSILENETPAYVGSDGTIFSVGQHLEQEDGSVYRVASIDPVKQTIRAEQAIGPEYSPFQDRGSKDFEFRQINGTKWGAAKPIDFSEHEKDRRFASSVRGYDRLKNLTPQQIDSHRDLITEKLKYHHATVPYVGPDGRVSINDAPSMPEGAKVIMPHDPGAADQIIQAIAAGDVPDYMARDTLTQITGESWYGGLKERINAAKQEYQQTQYGGATRGIKDILSRAKGAMHKDDQAKVDRAAQSVAQAVQAKIADLDNWTEKETTRAQVETLVYDHLYSDSTGLPDNYSEPEIRSLAGDIAQYLGGATSDSNTPAPSHRVESATTSARVEPSAAKADKNELASLLGGVDGISAAVATNLRRRIEEAATGGVISESELSRAFNAVGGSEPFKEQVTAALREQGKVAAPSARTQEIADAVSAMQRAEAMMNPKERMEAMNQAISGLDPEEVSQARAQRAAARREARVSRMDADTAPPAAPTEPPTQSPNKIRAEIKRTTHAKKNVDLHVVALGDRVSRDKYDTLVGKAKSLGGWYSSYSKLGAIPGFQFTDPDKASQFLDYTRSLEKSLRTYRIGGYHFRPEIQRGGTVVLRRMD